MELLVGAYSSPMLDMAGNGEGIYSVAFDPETGAFGTPRLVAECVNPSALALSKDGKNLFAVREVFAADEPALLSFRVTPDLRISPLSHRPISGELPCHLAFDPDHGRIASAQYWTGDVALFHVRNGKLQPEPVYLTRSGNGPNVGRQEGPHAHFVTFTDSGEVLHLADLGVDSVVSHRLDDNNKSIECVTTTLPAGSGPRHMALTRDESRAYVICELGEMLVTLNRAGLGWEVDHIQQCFTEPKNEDGSCAAIRLSPNERQIYVSGRRQSRIVAFSSGGAFIGETDCGGLCPREFIVTSDGNWIIAANQNSDSLTGLRRDPQSGSLTPTSRHCVIGSPVALVEFPSHLP